jgi:hypothetical protein
MDDNRKRLEAWKPDLELLQRAQLDTPEGEEADWEMCQHMFGLEA